LVGRGGTVGALRVDFIVVPMFRRGCLRGRGWAVVSLSSFFSSSEMESGSSPLYFASRTAVA
jgi:hypothetical protein